MQVNLILHRATWLNQQQKAIIQQTLATNYEHQLSSNLTAKLCAILCCIPLAETKVLHEGKIITKILTSVLSSCRLFRKCFSTIGTWNLHVRHASKFNSSPEEFRLLLERDELGLQYVATYILKYIGIHKSPELIFAEYNAGDRSSTFTALQQALNYIMANYHLPIKIAEDGAVEEECLGAVKICRTFLPQLSFNQHSSELELLKMLQYIEQVTGKQFMPCIPINVSARGFKYVWKMIKKRKWWNIPFFFHNKINVHLYVQHAMRAYHMLLWECE